MVGLCLSSKENHTTLCPLSTVTLYLKVVVVMLQPAHYLSISSLLFEDVDLPPGAAEWGGGALASLVVKLRGPLPPNCTVWTAGYRPGGSKIASSIKPSLPYLGPGSDRLPSCSLWCWHCSLALDAICLSHSVDSSTLSYTVRSPHPSHRKALACV